MFREPIKGFQNFFHIWLIEVASIEHGNAGFLSVYEYKENCQVWSSKVLF